MTRSHRESALVAGFALVLMVLSSVPARASHYRLVSGFPLITEPERVAFKNEKIRTTQALLKATGKRAARRALAKSTGISLPRLTELATQCDLLRVPGLGPSAVRLLQAARVRHTAGLRHSSASQLHGKLKAVKARLGLAQVVPQTAELQGWISHAKKLRTVLEGVR